MYLTTLVLFILGRFFYLILTGYLEKWYWTIFSYGWLFSLFTYELWFSYGIIGGDSAKDRGSPISNLSNALINSLGDGLVSVAMVRVCLRSYGKSVFRKWDWGAFRFLFLIGNIQNLFVSLVIYPKLSVDRLSLSPLTPIRVPNVILTQEAWIIYPFIFYYYLINHNIIR